MDLNPIQEVAVRRPGHLLSVGLQMMGRFCNPASSTPVGPDSQDLVPTAVKYYLSCVKPVHRMDAAKEREMRTVAQCIDMVVCGQIAQVGDVLMQRFKSLELESAEGSSAMSRHLELLPPSTAASLTLNEREAVTKLEVRDLRLAKLSSKR